jgi:protoporphyrinogen oxidase
VILGAGVAGLGAALRLGEAGRWRPLLLERDDRPGGLARSLHFKGVSSDLGPHRIHTEIPEVGELIERIAAKSLYTVQRRSHIFLNGRFLPYPPSALAMARNLGPLRLARFGASYLAGKLSTEPAEETFESIMQAAFGPALYDYLLRPYIAKTWKTDPSLLHADTARVRVSAGSLAKMIRGLVPGGKDKDPTALRQFRYVRGGAETLVRHLWEQAEALGAEMRLNSEVGSLELNEEGRIGRALVHRRGDSATAGGGIEPVGGEVFLSTLPLPVLLGRLLPTLPRLEDARRAAEGLCYLNMLFVVLIVRRKVITGDNWLYFPEPDLVFNRGYEAKSMDPGMAPEDRSVLCLEITLRPDDPRWKEGDADWLKLVGAQVASTGLFAEHEIDEGLVYRLPYAYPVYGLDYAERLGTALEGLRGLGNLLTLGRQGLFNHNNMDHSIYMGLQAADRLNQAPLEDSITLWYDSVSKFKRLRIID